MQRVEMQEELAISPEKIDQVQQIDDLLKKLEKATNTFCAAFGLLGMRATCSVTPRKWNGSRSSLRAKHRPQSRWRCCGKDTETDADANPSLLLLR